MCGSALTGLGSADGLVSRVVGRVSVVVGASVVVAQAVTSSTRATPPNHLITRPSSRTVDWSIRIGAEARRGPLPIWNLNQEPVAAVEVRRLRSCRGRGIEKDFGQIWSLADLPRPKSLPDPGAQPGAGVSRRTSDGSGHWPTPHVQSPAPTQARSPTGGTSRRTSVRSGHWPTSRVQSPRAQASRAAPGRGIEKDFGQIWSLADLPRPKSPRSGIKPGPGEGYRERLRSDPVTGLTSHVQSPRAHPVAQAVMPRVGTRRTAPGLSRRGRSLVNLERKGSDSALKPTQCSPCQWGEFWWTACCATSPPIRL